MKGGALALAMALVCAAATPRQAHGLMKGGKDCKTSNGCPVSMSFRYPGTTRCFAKKWAAPQCDFGPTKDAAHPACTFPCLPWVKPRPSKRSVMVWLLNDCPSGVCNATGWAPRIASIKAHRDNFTAISPLLYNIHIDGSFAHATENNGGSYAELFPYVRELNALGLEVHPLIQGPPNLQGQAALMRNPKRYIDAAVARLALSRILRVKTHAAC